jgi:hypothetical protein
MFSSNHQNYTVPLWCSLSYFTTGIEKRRNSVCISPSIKTKTKAETDVKQNRKPTSPASVCPALFPPDVARCSNAIITKVTTALLLHRTSPITPRVGKHCAQQLLPACFKHRALQLYALWASAHVPLAVFPGPCSDDIPRSPARPCSVQARSRHAVRPVDMTLNEIRALRPIVWQNILEPSRTCDAVSFCSESETALYSRPWQRLGPRTWI